MQLITAGESHNQKVVGILLGFPAGVPINPQIIDQFLDERRNVPGRSSRQTQPDIWRIVTGVRDNITTGSPITLEIENCVAASWNTLWTDAQTHPQPIARPGHADFVGAVKYQYADYRNVSERASARETVIRTALGALCVAFLQHFNMQFHSYILQCGLLKKESNENSIAFQKRCLPYLENLASKHKSCGGKIRLTVESVPIGLGSYVHWEDRLEGKLAHAFMSIPTIKAVENGAGTNFAELEDSGDGFVNMGNGEIKRASNKNGGIEGGISNGESLEFTLTCKAIPSWSQQLGWHIQQQKAVHLQPERSDTTALFALPPIIKAMAAFILMDVFLQKFGGDSLIEIQRHFLNS